MQANRDSDFYEPVYPVTACRLDSSLEPAVVFLVGCRKEQLPMSGRDVLGI